MLMKKFITLLLVLTGMVSTASADTYVVAGNSTLMGSDWNTSDAANVMTLKSGTIYTLTKDITSVPEGTYQFKIVQNSDWNYSWGEDGDHEKNNWIDVADGCTSITFVFDSNTHKNYAYTDKTTFSIQGTFEGWGTDYDMTRGADLYTYTFEWSDFSASANTYDYKARYDHAWTHAIPQSGNQSYEFKEAGTYDLLFTLNKLTNTLTMSAKKVIEIGDYEYATFSSALNAYNFAGTGVEAYYISKINPTYVQLTSIEDVPAGNGVLLKASKGRYSIPFGEASGSIDGNKLWAANSDTDVDGVAGGGAYILYHGEFHPATAGSTIPAGKAYIRKCDVPAGEAHSLTLVFDDNEGDVTGIESLKKEQNLKNEYFNLAGQRVAQPTKGLYVVNGKKVVIK